MIKQLHPSLKACKCGYICTKRELYKHFDDTRRTMKAMGESPREFFAGHGEVPLNEDDPRLNAEEMLNKSLIAEGLHPDQIRALVEDSSPELKELDRLGRELGVFPPKHRLDDNNTERPTI